jgi:NADPH:quinone reductase-like Zn-dependent oxidoreductase
MEQLKNKANTDHEPAKSSIPQTIRAIGFNRFGGPEVLEEVEITRPVLKPEQVLIKVAAVGVNQADWRFRNGQFRFFMSKKRPFIPGSDVAGIVVEVGEAVTRFQPGQAVYAMLPTVQAGGYAEYVAVEEQNMALAPANLSLTEAAAVPLAALTALQALRDKARLQPGARVLIYGASGGVGTFAVQIAKTSGASVTAVCSEANAELARRLGADEVIDYARENFTTRQAEYDVIFDAIGSYSLGQVRKALRPKGVLVSVNPVRGNPLARFFASLKGSKQIASVVVRPDGSDLETLNSWFAAGQIRVVLDKQYAWNEASEAQRYSETLRVRGKLVLVVDPQLALKK